MSSSKFSAVFTNLVEIQGHFVASAIWCSSKFRQHFVIAPWISALCIQEFPWNFGLHPPQPTAIARSRLHLVGTGMTLGKGDPFLICKTLPTELCPSHTAASLLPCCCCPPDGLDYKSHQATLWGPRVGTAVQIIRKAVMRGKERSKRRAWGLPGASTPDSRK